MKNPAQTAKVIQDCSQVMVSAINALQDSVDRSAFIFSTMANLSGNIPDKEYADIRASLLIPCSVVGCNCQALRLKLSIAMDALRADFIEHMNHTNN